MRLGGEAAGIKIEVLGDQVAMAKAWRLCRNALAKKYEEEKTGVNVDEPISPTTAKDLSSRWFSRHAFELTGERLLVDTLQGKLHN